MSRARDELRKQGSREEYSMLRRALPQGRQLKVCVIGAGVAGLRASQRLLDRGVDVTLLEARNRYGGRMGQSKVDGRLVDLGPNWIHGTSDNPILDLARQTNTQLHSWDERQTTFDTDGSSVSEDDVAETSEAFWSTITDAFKYSNENFSTIPVQDSLMDFVERRALSRFEDSDEPQDVKQRKKQLLLHEALTWGGFVAGSTHRQSLKFFWLEETLEGENPFVAETYEKILNAIAEPVARRKDVMRYETVVETITHDEDRGEVVIDSTCDGQRRSEAFDEVVMTAPLGWLKQNKSAFRPSLPSRLDAAIDNIGYGNLDKVYIAFPHAFWHAHPTTSGVPITVTSSDEIPNTTATTAPLHNRNEESSASISAEESAQYPGFTHWYPPSYAPDTNPQRFNQQAMNLAALPSSCAHATLLYYISGDCALHVSKLQASADTPEELKRRMIQYFEPYFSLLPNYEPSKLDCTPTDMLATNWAADEHAGYGSYSNFQIGLEEGDKDIEVMRHGMPERRIWLAGEHTAPFVTLGTVTGAYWSGERVADRILDTYSISRHGR